MAKRKAAAPAAQSPASLPPGIACTRTIDALDDLACHFSAFEAVEQLLSPQKAGSNEDLSHVDRASLGMLFTLLNVGLREQINTSRAAAELAHVLTNSL